MLFNKTYVMKLGCLLLLPFLALVTVGCRKVNGYIPSTDTIPAGGNEWLIPQNRVVDGGPGKDGIPAISNPEFVSGSQASFLNDEDLIVGYRNGHEIKAYPHRILDWHEIVNDEVNGAKIAVIYCPLTGTATGWERMLANGETTFGVSGLLYNANIIPYDRKTNSNWSQLLLKSVNGSLKGKEVKNLQVIETTWKTWKTMFPASKILSPSTGFSRNYNAYPYGDYRTNNNALIFSVEPDDKRLKRKERVLGVIIGDLAKVYRFSSLQVHNGVIEDSFEGMQLVVAGNEQKNIMVAFEKALPDGTIPEFSMDESGTGFLKDQYGNTWDAFGVAMAGPLMGQQLKSPQFIMGYWMAFGAFYEDARIF